MLNLTQTQAELLPVLQVIIFLSFDFSFAALHLQTQQFVHFIQTGWNQVPAAINITSIKEDIIVFLYS